MSKKSFNSFCARLSSGVVSIPLIVGGMGVTLFSVCTQPMMLIPALPAAGIAAAMAPKGKKFDRFDTVSTAVMESVSNLGVGMMMTGIAAMAYAARGKKTVDEPVNTSVDNKSPGR